MNFPARCLEQGVELSEEAEDRDDTSEKIPR